MDRLISLLAALVGLIALAGAVLVQLNGQSEREATRTALAELSEKISQIDVGAAPSAAPSLDDEGFAAALLALQDRMVRLEQAMKDEATARAAAPAPAADAPTGGSALTADGPTTDCIPIGTRFMATAGDETPICKTDVVVKVNDVTDGTAFIDGAGPIVAGGFGKLGFAGCTVMVFTADLASGYAELRVTCQ